MAKKKAAAATDNEDLIGDGAPAGGDEDLLGGEAPAKKAGRKRTGGAKAATAKKAAGKTAAKSPAKKAAKTGAAKSPRGEGAFYFSPEDKEALAKKIAANKSITTKDAAAKYECTTWQARLAMVHLVNSEKGSMEKVGSIMSWSK